jgi:hypothetical protein
MTDDPFDEPLVVALLNDEPTITPRVPRTTAERYAFSALYRMGNGVTVFNFEKSTDGGRQR